MNKFTKKQGHNLINLYTYAAKQPDKTWIKGLLDIEGTNDCGACFCLLGHGYNWFDDKDELEDKLFGTDPTSNTDKNWVNLFGAQGSSQYDKELGEASEKVTALHRINRHLGMPQGLAKLFAETATAPGRQYAKPCEVEA